MKNFPILKNIGKEPSYFGLSLKSFILVIIEIIISLIFVRGIGALVIFLPIIVLTYFTLNRMENKYGNYFFSKFLKKYFENFEGTKISLSEIREALNKNKNTTSF